MQGTTQLSRLTEDHDIEDHEGHTCHECGGIFEKPLFATVTSSGNIQRYYACPRCMTKVNTIENQEREDNSPATSPKEPPRLPTKSEDSQACHHFMGYLRKRPKDMPVPDECLTCGEMVECLLR